MSAPVARWRRAGLTTQGSPASSLAESVLAQHPTGTPIRPVQGPMNWLLEEPSMYAPTSRWLTYRETCRRLVARHPENPLAAAYLEAAEGVLTWRTALPGHLHFWAED